MTLKTKWIDVLYNVATGSRNVRNFFTPIGAIFYGLLIFFFVVIALHADRLVGCAIVMGAQLGKLGKSASGTEVSLFLESAALALVLSAID